jgi:hypothetical protein
MVQVTKDDKIKKKVHFTSGSSSIKFFWVYNLVKFLRKAMSSGRLEYR